MVSVLPRFTTALAELAEPGLGGSEALPLKLSVAAARTLSADAAGISVMDVLRVPLGASDADAAVAERLQITVGDGPCIHAYNTGQPMVADQTQLAQNWPIFNDRLVAETHIRSVASLPLQTSKTRLGAIDLHWLSPRGVATLSLDEAVELADHIAEVLLGQPTVATIHGVTAPGWVDAEPAQRRMQVWQAVGMLNVACGLGNLDAIAILRAYAYSHDTDIDTLASEVLAGLVPLNDIAPQPTTT